MFDRLRRRLTVSAAGRNLAVDLAERHGCDAMEMLERELAASDLDPWRREVLQRARLSLEPLMAIIPR
jgi:hypothetical protein